MSRFYVSRRGLLRGVAAVGAASAMRSKVVWAADKKIFKVQVNYDYKALDPGDKSYEVEDIIEEAIFPRLTTYKEDTWDWELEDAESLEQVDPTHIKFKLRPGMMWTGGFGEVTVEDAKFSFELIANPDHKSAYQSDWGELAHVEVVDKYNGIIVLKQPMAALLQTTLPKTAGAIICKKAVEKLPDMRFGMDPPASCGPYKLKEYTKNQKLVIEKNPDWKWGGQDYDEIHAIIIPDQKTASIAYAAGELDATQLPMSSIPNAKKDAKPEDLIVARPAIAYWWLGMMVECPLFQDKRVRQAVQYCVDTKEICDAAFFGIAEPATGMISPGIIGHRKKSLLPEKPDYEKAKALLAEAGHPDGMKWRLLTKSTLEHQTAAEVVQSQLAKGNIQVEITPEDSGTIFDRSQSKDGRWKDDQMILWRYTVAPDPSWYTEWFIPEEISQWNWERWNNAEFGELHKKGRVETDVAKRQAIYERMQDIMDEDGYYVWITHGVNAWVVNTKKASVALWPDAYLPFLRHCKPA